ncbi:MAG: hypothetical protein ACRYGL_20935 [Janthinobacterium lividum]
MTEKKPFSVVLTDVVIVCKTWLIKGFQKRNVSSLAALPTWTIVAVPAATCPMHKGFRELARISLYKIERLAALGVFPGDVKNPVETGKPNECSRQHCKQFQGASPTHTKQ